MKSRIASLALLATSVAASMALGAAADAKTMNARPMFTVIPMNAAGHQDVLQPSGSLQTWNGSFKDLTNQTVNFKMVGTDPTSTNTTTTVNVIVIPVIMVYGKTNGNMTFDPRKDTYPDAVTVLKRMESSPVFKPAKFKSGHVNLGNSQYIDAFQRANFWSTVQNEPNYHVLLKITKVDKPLKIEVTPTQGSVITNPFGSIPTGTFSINAFDSLLNAYIVAHTEIDPTVLPLFITDNVYLTSGGCCIGGYHSARTGGQTYSYTTMVTEAGDFSEDIDALSHEVGEWMDDPLTNNHVNCNDNSILEVGDPLEVLANYGTFPVTVGTFTFHPQDLVFIGYFGDHPIPSANHWITFKNSISNVCPGQ